MGQAKPNILIIGQVPPPYNGMSVVTRTILDSSLKERFVLIHLDISDRRPISNVEKFDLINVFLAFLHGWRFLRLLILKKPDIVYSPISQNNLGCLRDFLFLFPARIFKRRTVLHLHGGYFREFYEKSGCLMRLLIRFGTSKSEQVIVLGECLKHIFKDFIPEDKISVVPNGLEDFAAQTDVFREKNQNSKCTILFLSNLIKAKGLFDVIKAAPRVLDKYRNASFIFAGDWFRQEDKERIFSFIKEHNLSQNVTFTGPVAGKEKERYYLRSDIFILPSYNEGQPFVILEAMAAGLPVITTDTGAIKETVIDGENGFIVEKGNPQQIAEKIILLIEKKNTRREMGSKNRERFLKYYTKDRFSDNLGKVFEKAIAE